MSEHLSPPHLSSEDLRQLFLFADLDDEQLDWVAGHGDVVAFPADTDLAVEGAPADCFYVLLSGTLTLSRRVGRDEVEFMRSSLYGGYAGATQFYLGDQVAQTY